MRAPFVHFSQKEIPKAVIQEDKLDPEFKVAEGDLNTIGLRLGFVEDTREAGIRVFKFALYLFP